MILIASYTHCDIGAYTYNDTDPIHILRDRSHRHITIQISSYKYYDIDRRHIQGYRSLAHTMILIAYTYYDIDAYTYNDTHPIYTLGYRSHRHSRVQISCTYYDTHTHTHTHRIVRLLRYRCVLRIDGCLQWLVNSWRKLSIVTL